VNDYLATAAGWTHRDDPVAPRTGGPAGNARLTAWVGLLVLAFGLAETATLVSLGSLITVHILIGAYLVPLILLKTATTGWRIARYYVGAADYQQAGPPLLLLRLLGPLVVLTSLAIVGSGLALIGLGRSAYTTIFSVLGFRVSALTIHQASFVAWAATTVAHLLARTVPAIKLARGVHDHATVPGRGLRVAAVAASAAIGVAVAVLVLHFSGHWTHDGGRHGRYGPPGRHGADRGRLG
jgi:hypothetical protein